MRLLDDRGRILGRVNLIDAALLLLVPVLAFTIYTTYRGSRPVPVPALLSIEPAAVVAGAETRITLHGRHLRSLLKMTVGPSVADVFVAGETLGAATIHGLAPGTYDVVLDDQGGEASRLPKALTVTAAALPTTEVQAVGVFTLLEWAQVEMLGVGTSLPDGRGAVAVILAVKPAQPAVRQIRIDGDVIATPVAGKLDVPAVIRLRCTTLGDDCVVGDTVVGRGVSVRVPFSGGSVAFRVIDVRSTTAPATFDIAPRARGRE